MISVIGGASSARRVSLRLLRAYLLLPSAKRASSYASVPEAFTRRMPLIVSCSTLVISPCTLPRRRLPRRSFLSIGWSENSEQRQDHQRDQRQLPRDAEQDRDVDDHQRRALQRLRHDLRKNEARLEGVVDHPRQNLPRLHLREISERQMREVAVDGIAQIARHVLLQARAKLSGDPHEQILRAAPPPAREDDVAQRAHLVAGDDAASDRRVEELRDPARLERSRAAGGTGC